MDIRQKNLMKLIKVRTLNTLNIYIARPEFAHINKCRATDKSVYYTGITQLDLQLLRLYAHRSNLTEKQKLHLSDNIKMLQKLKHQENKRIESEDNHGFRHVFK